MTFKTMTVNTIITKVASKKLAAKKAITICVPLLIAALALGLGRAAYQAARFATPSLSKSFPCGALLYLQAKDFSSLLADWNGSPQKQQWLRSSNYQIFSRFRLLSLPRCESNGLESECFLPRGFDCFSLVLTRRAPRKSSPQEEPYRF